MIACRVCQCTCTVIFTGRIVTYNVLFPDSSCTEKCLIYDALLSVSVFVLLFPDSSCTEKCLIYDALACVSVCVLLFADSSCTEKCLTCGSWRVGGTARLAGSSPCSTSSAGIPLLPSPSCPLAPATTWPGP